MSAPDLRIARVAAADVRPLRSEILRPGIPPEKLVYEGDDDADSLHVAAVDADGGIHGIASLRREAAPDRDVTAWRLRGMATRSELRGSGVGRRLLQACFRHVRSHGGGLLWCNARTVALGFYDRLGFRREGDEFDIPGVGPHYVMSRWLAHLRPARSDEAAVLTELALRAKAHWGYSHEEMQLFAPELQVDAAAISGGGRHHVVAEVQGEMVGFHGVTPEADGVVRLDALWVEPVWIGRGIGRELFEHARGIALKLGAAELRIVSDPNAAGFYLRMGAAPAGEVASTVIPGRHLPHFALHFA